MEIACLVSIAEALAAEVVVVPPVVVPAEAPAAVVEQAIEGETDGGDGVDEENDDEWACQNCTDLVHWGDVSWGCTHCETWWVCAKVECKTVCNAHEVHCPHKPAPRPAASRTKKKTKHS